MKKVLGILLKVLVWVLNILLVLLIISGLTQRLIPGRSIGIFGVGYAVVVSGSMVPALQVDDMIIYHEHGTGAYEVGDIIVFESERPSGTILVTHRIVRIGDGTVTTLGDANHGITDDPVRFDQIIGKVVFRIPKVGAAISFLRTPAGLIVLGVVAAGLIAVNLVFPVSGRKGRDRKAIGSEKAD